MSGRTLRVVARIVGSGAGAPVRRYLGAQLVDQKLASVDIAAAGNPPPLYMPRSWKNRS